MHGCIYIISRRKGMNLGYLNGVARSSYANAAVRNNSPKDTKKVNKEGVVGNPKLSKKALEYYEQLKAKYSDMDFVLVSDDESVDVMKNAEKYVTGDKDVVLIDESTVEKMANDEDYREKQEGVIDDARDRLQKIADELVNAQDGAGKAVTGFGVHINADGTTTFFAVMAKANQAIVSRANDIRAQSRENEKVAMEAAAKRKAEKKFAEQRLAEKTQNKADAVEKKGYTKPVEVKVEADNVEDLLKKINDTYLSWKMDDVQTEEEKNIGQTIDFTA
jgi:hypothetical protein